MSISAYPPAAAGPVSPHVSSALLVDLAAGGSGALDSDQVLVGRVGRLWGVDVRGTVPFQTEVYALQDGVPSSGPVAVGGSLTGSWSWRTPSPAMVTVNGTSGGGFDGYRVVVYNADPTLAADFAAVFYTDEPVA